MIKNSSENDKRDKYNVGKRQKDIEKRTFKTYIFASEMEKKYYVEVLLPRLENGEITSIVVQPQYILIPSFIKDGKKYLPMKYVADFEVIDKDGNIIVYDVKGFMTEVCKIKIKLYQYFYPNSKIELITLSPKYGGWMDYYELQKLRGKFKRGQANG